MLVSQNVLPGSQSSIEFSQQSQDVSLISGDDKFTNTSTQIDDTNGHKIVLQLKENFNDTPTSTFVETILLPLKPKSWTEIRPAEEFHTSRRQAIKTKALIKKNGILSSPNTSPGRKLSSAMKNLVTFYLKEGNTRIMPGKKALPV